MPCIAWGPGTVRQGRTNAIISGIDFLPTFVSMAGLKPPQGIDLDGRDISAVLTRDAPSPHEQILLFNNEEVAAIRMQRWKYVNETYDRGMLVNFGDKKEYLELYDMNLDVGEKLQRRREASSGHASPSPARATCTLHSRKAYLLCIRKY